MLRPITISSFKKLPGAFLIALALFIAAESLIYANRADFIDDFWNKFIINEQKLLELPKNYDYLIMGDSIQKTGIKPADVSDDLLNLGLPGGKPMSMYLLLNRYLKNHKPPKVIFLYVDPEDAEDSLFVILRYFVSIPEFASIWNDLTWREREVFFMKYWSSLDLRKVGLTIRDRYPHSNNKFIETMIKNHGWMPGPRMDKAIEDNYFVKNKQRYQRKISISFNDMKYLDKFMALADSKDIKIVFVGFLEPKGLYSVLRKTGFNRHYSAFYRSLAKHYKKAYFVKKNILYMDNKYFGDQSHVNNEGSELYTKYFKNQIFDPALKIVGE